MPPLRNLRRNQTKTLLGIETSSIAAAIATGKWRRNQTKTLLGIETLIHSWLTKLKRLRRNQTKTLLGIETTRQTLSKYGRVA